ncbi:MAG: DUF4115 domain-containing protein [Nitrosomonadales bacterium]|nr:DUF4115 domain-containing protein [Nitrosomonadales bacterium]
MDISDAVSESSKRGEPVKPVLNVGLTLREAREGMGLSVHDIANRIKFAPRQVEALEANDFAHLPKATFLRGFVRCYARVLLLDEELLIAALPVETHEQVVNKAQSVTVSFPTVFALQKVNLLWLAGALGVALLLGLFVLLQGGEDTVPAEVVVETIPLPGSDAAVSAVPDTESQTMIQEAPKAEEPKVAEPVKAPRPAVVTVPQAAPAPAPASVPQVATVTPPVAEVKPAIPLEILMRRPLHFVVDEASWVEVKDVNGVVLLSRNVPRGGEKWIGGPGRAPYDVSISNPSKVRIYYKGNKIDLSAYAAMEMAHLKVK